MKQLIAIALVLAAVACDRPQQNVVPRREGYPRIQAYEARYEQVEGLPMAFAANASASATVDVRNDGSAWLTLDYPAYQAKVYVTFTPVTPSTVNEAIDNRLERIALNFGNVPVEASTFVSKSGYDCTLAVAASALSTPVQFIAIPPGDGSGLLVSGSVFMQQKGTTADEIAPIVELLTKDLSYSLENM